jgi:hypothetical protein
MTLKIGTFFVENGTNSSDYKTNIKSGEVYFGKSGNDQMWSNATGTLYYQGSYWYIPAILSGGQGGDTYNIGANDYAIIVDGDNGTSDVLNISANVSRADRFFTIDNRHLFLGFSYNNTSVLVADGMNHKGAIEKISFNDMTFNGSPASISTLVDNYSQGNISFEYAISSGIFNTEVVGVSGASETRSLLNEIYNESSQDVASEDTSEPGLDSLTGITIGKTYKFDSIKDYDGNLHGYLANTPTDVITGYKYQGEIDVVGDGYAEAIFTNKFSGRWATVSVYDDGEIDFTSHGKGGVTRIVGIYQDPLVAAGVVEKDSVFDGSRTFINDLKLDNLVLKASGDIDGDGFQEVYWSKVDNTAYLRAVMHADGNIQYANYQNLDQMTNYLTGHGFADYVDLIA